MIVKLLKISPGKFLNMAYVDIELMPICLKIKGIMVFVPENVRNGSNLKDKCFYTIKLPKAPILGKKDPKTKKFHYYSVISFGDPTICRAFFDQIQACI